MKILIYGAGVIGCTYGWQLTKAGHDITVLVRQGKKSRIEKDGIDIFCSDFRGKQKQTEQVTFRPKVIDSLSPDNDFEYIIVATNCIYLKDILPVLAESAGKAHILFFQNIWNDFETIARFLSPEQYFFGFPFKVGGGRDEHCIHCAISGMKNSATLLGEVNGEITPRIVKMSNALEKANLKPLVSKHIKTWLITHYAIAASLSAGIIKAGGGKNFAGNSQLLKNTVKSIREGFEICYRKGFDPKVEKANRPYYLPLFFLVPVLMKIYSNETLCIMFDGHTQHAPDEIKRMLEDVIADGEKYNVQMLYLKSLQKPEY
ncbi:ketopantoate reductase family protein [Parabacteroides timonensis]|uniref:ketopantoate reductase family protein n=1 Tax=Parabacteroides timonensis TaxID=1871013 RepID=UPI00094E23AC|nr:2-dehydropantoate 2-reductase N-terminal domain-containing protein [Parabacteroides timonensis]